MKFTKQSDTVSVKLFGKFMYKRRHIEEKLRLLVNNFKVVLILGARQVGKSTLLKNTFPYHKHLTFDPVQDLYGAKADPDLFLQNFSSPLILDEIQFAPALLAAIKRRVDSVDANGQYILTGSQNLSILRTVSESMAGRVAIVHLGGLTIYETNEVNSASWLKTYLDNPDHLLRNSISVTTSKHSLYETLWRGSLPGLLGKENKIIPTYLSSYIQTYVERDIRLIENIQNLSQFDQFLGLASALTSQEINMSQIGREIGINPQTAKKWLDLMQYCYLWNELLPYSGNAIKRVSKKRKGYMADTGLACYLQRISSPEALARNPLLGSLFESHCVNMIANISNGFDLQPHFYHWRSNNGAEVDLILELNGCLYPIEIKCKTNLSRHDASGIKAFIETYSNRKIATGLILYAGTETYKLEPNIIALPWNASVV